MNKVPMMSRGTICSGADHNLGTTIGKIIKRPFLCRLALSGTNTIFASVGTAHHAL